MTQQVITMPNNWFQRYRRSSSKKQQPQQHYLEKDNDEANETVVTTTMSSCDEGLPDSTTRQHSRSASFTHRVRQQHQPPQPQQQPLMASSDHNDHRRPNDIKKNRAVYIKTGNHLYNDIEYYEYTIPNFQRQGSKQTTSSSLPQQQQQKQMQISSPPSSPMAASSLDSSLSSVRSTSYTDASVTAEGIWNYRDDDNKRSNRILSEFAMSAYLTADCS